MTETMRTYLVTVERTTTYEVQAMDEDEALDKMMRGEDATEVDEETTDMRVSPWVDDQRCESEMSGMRCQLQAGHGRYHKSGTAGWDDGN